MSGEQFDPDPHFPMEVSKGVFFCAVPACTQHKYPTPTILVPSRFEGGNFNGETALIAAVPSLTREKTEYAIGFYEKGPNGPVAVYQPADEWTPEASQ